MFHTTRCVVVTYCQLFECIVYLENVVFTLKEMQLTGLCGPHYFEGNLTLFYYQTMHWLNSKFQPLQAHVVFTSRKRGESIKFCCSLQFQHFTRSAPRRTFQWTHTFGRNRNSTECPSVSSMWVMVSCKFSVEKSAFERHSHANVDVCYPLYLALSPFRVFTNCLNFDGVSVFKTSYFFKQSFRDLPSCPFCQKKKQILL